MDADSSYGGSDTAHDLHSAHDDSTHHIGSSSPPHPGSTHLEHTSHPSDSAHPPSVPQSTHEVTLNVCYDDDDEDDSVMDSNKAEYLAATKIGVGNGEEPHSNLEETSRNFRSTNRLNESPPPEKGRRYSAGGGGVENPAFVGDVKSTFNHEKPYNGDLNNSTLGVCSLNKAEEPMTEAVNLELINMKPVGTNGTDQYDVGNGLTTIPLKKENNRDIGNPYDEYFVPVNEHRKYMRGEKLYVTKDKRGEKSKSKCFCWAVCLCVVALALIVGILAAVGVIGGEKSKPQEVARKLDNPEQPIVKGGLSIPGGSESKNPPPFTPEPPISTVSPMLPTTDLTGIIVPRVLESQITIDNLQYTPDLAQKNSSEYQALAQSLEDMIKSTLFPKDMLQYGPADIEVKVMEFSPGSVVVKYRIGWKFKQGIHSPRDPIDENILKKRMTAALEKNNGLMDRFHVLEDSVKTEKILDLCKIQNNDCEDVCVFDYHNLNFACLCPDGKHLDLDGKRCVEHDHGYLEHAHVHQHHPEPSAEPEPGHEHEPSAEPEPEPSAGHEHEPSAEPEPEPSAGHELEPSAEPEPEPSAGHEHEPSAEPEPEPSAGHEPEPSAEPEPEPSAGHEHEPSAEPEPEPSAGHEHEHSDEESSSSAEREPKSQFEPDLKELTVEPVGAEPEPSAEPEPAASPKPTELLVEPIEGNTSVTHQPYSEPSTTISNHLVHHQDESRAFHDHVIFAEPEMITVSPITEKVSVNTSAENKEPNNTTEAHMVTSTTESLKYVLNDLLIEHHDLHQIVESTTAQPESVEDDFVTTEEPFDLHAVHQEIHPDDFYYGNIIPIKEESKTVIETTTVMNEESTTMIPEKLNETTTGRNDMEVKVPISNETNVITSTTEKLEEIVPTTMVVIGTTEKFNETKVVSVNATNDLSTAGDFNETKDVEAITSTTEKQNATMEKMTLLPEIQNDTITTTTTTSKSNSIGPNIVLPEAEVITTTISPEEDTTDSTSEELNTTATTTLEADMTTVTPSSIEENEVTHPLIIPVVIRESPDYYESREVMAMTTIKPRENVTESQEFSRISETSSGSHENLTLYQPEHMHDEYMSPFLPDLENDTFINSLHSEEHFLLDHKEESHENASVTKPPSLEFDQLNHTNPFDNHTSDASLGIVPLRPEEENNVTPATTVSSKENVLLNGVPNTTESQTSEITSTEAVRTEILPTNATGITTEASLPPEIINNVHSNPIFEKHFSKFIATDGAAQTTTKIPETTTLHHHEATTETPEITTIETIPEITTIQMSETSTTKVPEIGANTTVSNEINSQASTEDLIAMETTTKKVSNETRVASLPVVDETKTDTLDTTTNTILNETKVENLPAVETTTMPDNDTRKEILSISDITNETSNTTAHTISNNISSMSSEALETSTKTASNEISPASAEDLLALETTTSNEKLERKEATTIHAEILETAKTDVKVISEDENDITSSSTPEPVLYRVRELVSDITTTEKLFVSRKTTTESSEDLSVEPLVGKEELTFNDRPSSEHFNDLIDEQQQIKKGTLEDDKLTMESKCSIGEFQCVNGTSVRNGKYCVSNSDKCDSVLDCTDGSDEEGCEKEGCLTNFQCASGQCLKRHLVCDGILNCNDGSDEMNCDTWSCNTDELSCGTAQRCIPTSWKCDGKAHCQDGSDERACQFNECHADSFHCKSQGRCIPMSWKCDGRSDCADGEDEQSCDCNQEEFKCSLGGGCVPKSSRCDGTEQCPDRSDEWNCLRLGNATTEKKTLQWRSQDGTWHPVCMDWVVWNTTYADRACRKMGYTGSSSLESVPRSEGIESRDVYDLDGSTGGLRFRKREGDCEQFASITCQEHSCRGSSNLDISSARIVGGNKASITQWPSLGILHNEKSNVYCTATLLTPLWAIAGYSCVVANSNAENAENWDLYVGSTNKYDNSSGQARKVQEIVRHPQVKFSEFEFVNDVVLVQLQRPVTININVSSICLPEKDIEPRQLCIVAGWGVNKPGEPDMQQYLHYLPVPMIDSSECNSTKYYNGKLDSDKICAGSTGSEKTPCYNDEGAPLMCYSDPSASWELRGLLSHHGNCGAGKQPAVYTALSRDLRSWIKDTIGRQAFEDEQ